MLALLQAHSYAVQCGTSESVIAFPVGLAADADSTMLVTDIAFVSECDDAKRPLEITDGANSLPAVLEATDVSADAALVRIRLPMARLPLRLGGMADGNEVVLPYVSDGELYIAKATTRATDGRALALELPDTDVPLASGTPVLNWNGEIIGVTAMRDGRVHAYPVGGLCGTFIECG